MTKTEKVFISGPMRTPGYEKDFAAAAGKLAEDGYEPMNPAVAIPADMDRPAAMRIALAMIDAADLAYFMPGWKRAPGARLEHDYCEYVGKRIFGNSPNVEEA